jgi:transcriptional regulator with XRE-family HTH domain
VDAARVLREARLKAGLTQRELAQRTRVAQPAIARIESGKVVPRVDTLDRLLRGCGWSLETAHRIGEGLDRTGIVELLRIRPAERARLASAEANNLADLLARARVVRR